MAVDLCTSIVQEILVKVLGEDNVRAVTKPTFIRKKSPDVDGIKNKKLRLEDDDKDVYKENVLFEKISRLETEMQLLENNLKFVSNDRDHWRAATDLARNESEKLAKENSQLNLSNSELVDLVEEQGKICTVLSAELVELIWSLTSKPSALGEIQQFQVSSFCKLVKQVVDQFLLREESGGTQVKAETKLTSAMIGTMINLSSHENASLVILSTYEGNSVVQTVSKMVSACKDQNILQLGFMFLVNILKTNMQHKSLSEVIDADLLGCLQTTVARWSKSERSKMGLQKVANRLEVLLTFHSGPSVDIEQ